jgi:hypothetical protein
MHRSTIQTFALGLLALAPALIAQPRRPQGIYAVVNIEEYTQAYL